MYRNKIRKCGRSLPTFDKWRYRLAFAVVVMMLFYPLTSAGQPMKDSIFLRHASNRVESHEPVSDRATGMFWIVIIIVVGGTIVWIRKHK